MKRVFLVTLLLGLGLSANAYDSYYIPNSTNPAFQFNVYSPGETAIIDGEKGDSDFKIPEEYITPLLISAQEWGKKIGVHPAKPAVYSYFSIDDYNAMAGSQHVTVAGSAFKITRTQARLLGLTITSPKSELNKYTGDGVVFVGLGISEETPGWGKYSGKHVLYHGELPDLYPIMTHEMMHSLGVTSAVENYYEDYGDKNYYFSKGVTDPITLYDSNLRIYTGTSNPVADPANEIAPSPGMVVGPGGFDIEKYSPYFVGQNVIKVLGDDTDYDTARNNIVANGGIINYSDYYSDNDIPYPAVYGLPIHPSDSDEYDLSHLELRNSYMSHQDFRNWLIPMEVELALMNDLGYNIDLRKYFGKSYYLNNRTDTYTAGFSEWNGTAYTGNPSKIDQAVGIHIYGNNNNITQAVGDISLLGEGSVGVRIDGVENTYNLNSGNIYANGKENLGIAVTWGNKHNINIASGTNVIASGKDGIAISLDYGANLFGTASSNIKGSYLDYRNFMGFELSLPPDPENSNELVTDLNINGTLRGEKAAIYISDNAHVKNININDGAQINGNIISEWNSVTSLDKAHVMIKDSDTGDWRQVNPKNPKEFYYTNLNFNSPSGVTVKGDIIGDIKVFNTLRMKNNTSSTINFKGNLIYVNSLNNKGDINLFNKTGIAISNGKISGDGNINVLQNAGLGLSGNINNITNNLSFNNASFDIANNSINGINMAGMELSGKNNLALDIDLNSLTSDRLIFSNSGDLTVNNGAGFHINDVNLINTNRIFTDKRYFIPFVSSKYNNQNLLGHVTYNGSGDILTPIFKYNLGYEEEQNMGGFAFTRNSGRSYKNYNPAVVAAPVAAQFGGYISQLNAYDQAFHNLDMTMLMTKAERQALRMANSYASAETPQVFSPVYMQSEHKGGWVRPYSTFENVGLKNGPKVHNVLYGSYFGGDSPLYKTKNGWDYQYSVYAGYNGSHQNYAHNSIYQNGGTLGATAIWYKDNFFTALTANAGASVADASTMYGNEDFPMLMSGIASKTGYNWEFAEGKFIIQPSLLMSYTFVNTFDYTNAAGVRIKSDPLNAINIAPGLKFIGNLKYGWQPYAGIQMVWNIMDKTDFKACNAALPSMSVKPYIQYGVGVQKRWGERFTGFLQAMIRNGGRNGISLSAGFRWAIGK